MDQEQSSQTSPPEQQNASTNSGSSSNTKLMGVLSYLGILVIIPFLMAKDDPIVKFHIKQGLVLVVIEAIVFVAGSMMYMWQLMPLLSLINLGVLILSIIGIVNVIQGNQKELPLIGSFASNFKI